MADNIWQHRHKSSLGKIRLLCALEEAERWGNWSRQQPPERWGILGDFAPTADTQYEALWPGRRMGTADYSAERLQNRKL